MIENVPSITIADSSTYRKGVLNLTLEAKCKVLLAFPPELKCLNCEGWTVHHLRETPFPVDDPRSAHSLKIIAPRLFPNARTVISGDTKCPHSLFHAAAMSHANFAKVDGFFLRHPKIFHRQGSIAAEFDRTIRRLGVTSGMPRHEDIAKQRQRYHELGQFQSFVDVPGRMPDSMCLGYKLAARMTRFYCTWNCEVVEFSMREQLSFDFARRVTHPT
eukprot:726800-Pyramimonas_sp.AAC.1